VQVVLNRNPAFARHLLVWGMVAELLIGITMFAEPSLPFLGILCVFVAAMLIKDGGLIIAPGNRGDRRRARPDRRA